MRQERKNTAQNNSGDTIPSHKTSSATIDLADRESEDLFRLLQNQFPGNFPITILLYQPISMCLPDPHKECKARLVDVGPRPPGLSLEPIYQALSGESGEFMLNDNTARRFFPTSKRIDKKTVDSYVGANPGDWRKAQVAIEKARHSHHLKREWIGDVPPIGAWMHQSILSPLPDRTVIERYPNLGSIYTINEISNPSPSLKDRPSGDGRYEQKCIIWRLTPDAVTAGKIAMRNRLTALLGNERLHRLIDFSLTGSPIDPGEACNLVGSLLLAHHWFFPYDPLAHGLIAKLIESRISSSVGEASPQTLKETFVSDLYSCHGCCPSPANSADERTPEHLLSLLNEDLVNLIRFAHQIFSNSREEIDISREKLQSPLNSMLMLMCGALYSVSGSPGYYVMRPICSLKEWQLADEVTVGLPDSCLSLANGSSPVSLHLPIFHRATLDEVLHRGNSEDKPLAQLAPGNTGELGRPKNTIPAYRICTIKRSGGAWYVTRAKWPEKSREGPWNAWLRDYARYRIAQEKDRLPNVICDK